MTFNIAAAALLGSSPLVAEECNSHVSIDAAHRKLSTVLLELATQQRFEIKVKLLSDPPLEGVYAGETSEVVAQLLSETGYIVQWATREGCGAEKYIEKLWLLPAGDAAQFVEYEPVANVAEEPVHVRSEKSRRMEIEREARRDLWQSMSKEERKIEREKQRRKKNDHPRGY